MNALRWVLAVGFAWGTAPSFAQAPPPGAVEYQRKTVINFEDDTIEGDLKTPDGEYLEARKKARHKSLIKIRENFRRRIIQSAGSL
jgi:hypothetical protein